MKVEQFNRQLFIHLTLFIIKPLYVVSINCTLGPCLSRQWKGAQREVQTTRAKYHNSYRIKNIEAPKNVREDRRNSSVFVSHPCPAAPLNLPTEPPGAAHLPPRDQR